MGYFSEDYFSFFEELQHNNHKQWFDIHRLRYQKSIKEPFEQFVEVLIELWASLDSEVLINTNPKDCIFRINRDIRFSKDKTPYKLYRSAVISPKGKKDCAYPSLYFEATLNHFRVYNGVYRVGTVQIEKIRQHILKHSKRLSEIVEDRTFIDHFDQVRGDRYKVLPKLYQPIGKTVPLMYHKNWYIYKTYPPETILREDILQMLTKDYQSMSLFQSFFREALNQ